MLTMMMMLLLMMMMMDWLLEWSWLIAQ